MSSVLLKEELCWKLMLKYDTQDYFRQFTKTLSVWFQGNTTHTDLLMCNCVWPE